MAERGIASRLGWVVIGLATGARRAGFLYFIGGGDYFVGEVNCGQYALTLIMAGFVSEAAFLLSPVECLTRRVVLSVLRSQASLSRCQPAHRW